MDRSHGKRFPVDPNAYQLLEEIGDGVSATVHKALCIPLNETVAIKVLDLEKCSSDMDGIRREVQTMSLIDHPNVLRAHCSFPSGRSLWVVMPFMAGGSCLHIMKSAYPEGFEESVIATLLREVLKALVYLHNHGYIHRDVKAGNMLIDTNGAVKLADFGVSACLFDNGDRQRSWNTFVGTPCWMAPEVMQQLHGYDFKADVWSFGITALELAHGHAPFSKYPPMKVLLMTLQNAPPGLDYERDKRFSKSFKAMVGACLVKDPKKRPSAEKLLKHSFFKHARSTEYLARTILDGLIPLGERFRKLKARDADFLLQNKGTHENEEHLSQQEYIRGVSAWNFNIEDLKAQAALIDDIAEFSPREGKYNSKTEDGFVDDNHALDALHQEAVNHALDALHQEAVNQPIPSSIEEGLDGSLASSFAMRPLQALRDCFDICDDDTSTSSTEWQDATLSNFESHQHSSQAHDLDADCHVNLEPCTKSTIPERHNCLSGFLSHELVPSSSANASISTNRNGLERKNQAGRNFSSPLLSEQVREANSQSPGVKHEDLEGKIVQCRGRFKVTSADVGTKDPSTSYCSSNPHNGSIPTYSVLPMLKFILQQNALQREEVTELIRFAEQTSGRQTDGIVSSNVDLRQFCSASKRERNLQAYACELQQRISNFTEEIQNLKLQNAQLQKQLDNLSSKEKPREKDEPLPQ